MKQNIDSKFEVSQRANLIHFNWLLLFSLLLCEIRAKFH